MTAGVRLFAAVAVSALLACAQASASERTMDAEIDHLLATVAESNCTFIRNGKEYGSHAARDHLQMKRKRGSKHFDTTERFIERIASKSSWSGRPYRIRCDDSEEDAGAWFSRALESFRSRTVPAKGAGSPTTSDPSGVRPADVGRARRPSFNA